MPAHPSGLRLTWARWPGEAKAVSCLFREFHAWLIEAHGFDAPPILEDAADLPGAYASPGGVCLAYVEEELAGCFALRPLTERPEGFPTTAILGEAKRMYLRAPYRGMGLGRILVQAVKERASDAGFTHLLLDSLRSLPNAHRLYESEGFTRIAPYNSLPATLALHMACPLIPAAA